MKMVTNVRPPAPGRTGDAARRGTQRASQIGHFTEEIAGNRRGAKMENA
jgi:hypothetical protein